MPTDEQLGARVRGYLAPALADAAAWAALLDAPVPAAACDADGRLLFVNQAMLELLGYPLDSVLGTGWLFAVFPDANERQEGRAIIGEVLASPVTTRHRREVTCGDGKRRVLDLTSTTIRLPDGARGAMTIAVEAPAAQSQLAVGERGYRELLEDAPDVFVRFDVDGHLLFVSRAIQRYLGWTPDELYAEPSRFAQAFTPEADRTFRLAFAQVAKGDARTFDLPMQHRDGRTLILQHALYPIRDAAGVVRCIEGSARDITTVRQLEVLKARNEERAALDRLKSQLLANVSHELRTPLVSIKGYNELLLRGALGPLTPRQRRGLEIAGANTDRLIELIEALLDFARREEGRLEIKPARFDVREAVQDAVAALHDRIASRALTLRVDLPPASVTVMGDRARLAQVFRALLGNAEKFSEASAGEIVVAARAVGETVEVTVSDRGIGIPKEAQPKIFDRFYQVDASSTRRFGGAGLGLAMAKELVTLHGGEITVESAEGKGSTFTVRLPRAASEHKEPPPTRPVVLVGADAATYASIRPLLEGELQPIDLFWAASEAEVARRARRHRPDLVMLAFPSLQKVDALVDELKRDAESALPVVILTEETRRPIGRADLVTDGGDQRRLVAGLRRLLGRQAPAPAPRAPRVVIVEDEVEILDFTRFVLEREGYDVACLSSGTEALSTVDGDTDLVILDIALEESDGIEICRHLKSRPATRDVPILIMTAMSGEEVRQGSLGAGAVGYLMKPFGVDEFLRQVRLHVRGAEPQPSRESLGETN